MAMPYRWYAPARSMRRATASTRSPVFCPSSSTTLNPAVDTWPATSASPHAPVSTVPCIHPTPSPRTFWRDPKKY
jgi:hypothetical protein